MHYQKLTGQNREEIVSLLRVSGMAGLLGDLLHLLFSNYSFRHLQVQHTLHVCNTFIVSCKNAFTNIASVKFHNKQEAPGKEWSHPHFKIKELNL